MATGNRPPSKRSNVNEQERIRRTRVILLTILIGAISAGFIAAMILWAYHSDRFQK